MSAADSVFLDTNFPVYAHDRAEPAKGPHAQALLARLFAEGRPLLSTQVLSEFYWTTTRKLSMPLTHDEAVAQINRFHSLARIVPITWDIIDHALQAVARHGIPLWDAQILAAAAHHGALWVFSEDFQHRQIIDGVTFLNPFAPDFNIDQILGP